MKAKFLVAAGNIANYELHSTDEAVEIYNQALDEDPDDLKAFERIDKIMTAKKDWRNQERNYRKMIKRLGQEAPPEKKPTQIALWHALGEIYRSRLKDYKSATAAFEVCVQPGSGRDARATRSWPSCTSCRAPTPTTRRSRSTATWSSRRRTSAQMAVHMKTLRRLLHGDAAVRPRLVRDLGAGLPAQGRSRGAAVLRAVPAQGLRARARAAHRGAVAAATSITPTRTATSRTIFAAVSQAVAAVRAKEHKDWGLKRKDKRDVADRPAAVQQGVQLREPGAGRAAARAVPAPRVAGRAGHGERAREGAAHPVVRRRGQPAAGPAREGAGLRHRQEAGAHARRSLRPLAHRGADGGRAQGGVPGGAEAGGSRSSR